jgi:hypothetical protein
MSLKHVDYAQSGHVCRIQLPPTGPEAQRPNVEGPKAVDDFLLASVPLSMRGTELRKSFTFMSAYRVSMVEYENGVIAEPMQGGLRTGITVTFKNEECPKPTPHLSF